MLKQKNSRIIALNLPTQSSTSVPKIDVTPLELANLMIDGADVSPDGYHFSVYPSPHDPFSFFIMHRQLPHPVLQKLGKRITVMTNNQRLYNYHFHLIGWVRKNNNG